MSNPKMIERISKMKLIFIASVTLTISCYCQVVKTGNDSLPIQIIVDYVSRPGYVKSEESKRWLLDYYKKEIEEFNLTDETVEQRATGKVIQEYYIDILELSIQNLFHHLATTASHLAQSKSIRLI